VSSVNKRSEEVADRPSGESVLTLGPSPSSPRRSVTDAYATRVFNGRIFESRVAAVLYLVLCRGPCQIPTSYQRGTESFFASPQGDTLPISPGGQPVRPAETRSKRSPTQKCQHPHPANATYKNYDPSVCFFVGTVPRCPLHHSQPTLLVSAGPSHPPHQNDLSSRRVVLGLLRVKAMIASTEALRASKPLITYAPFSAIRLLIRYVSYANAAAAAPCDRTVSVPDTAQCSTVP